MVSFPSIDTNLFVDAYSKGLQQGKANPSIFSTVVNSFIEGIEENQQFESQELNNQIKQHEIDMQPVKDRIEEAQADSADAQVAAYRQDPESWVKLQQAKQQNALLEEKRQAELYDQETKFIDLMKTGDEASKADALLSGQYADLLAQKPQYRKEVVQQAAGWQDQTQAARVFEGEYAQLRAQHLAERKVSAELSLQKSFPEYERSANIGQLERDVAAALPNEPVNRLDLVLHGEIRTEKVFDKTRGPLKDEKGAYIKGPDGKPVQGLVDDMEKPPKIVRNFYYGKGVEKKLIRDVDPDTLKEYEGFRSDYWAVNDLDAHSGGLKDIEHQARAVQERRDAEKAKLQADLDKKNAEKLSDEEKFNSGVKVVATATPAPDLRANPKFEKALEAGRGKITANESENAARAAARQPSPQSTPMSLAVPLDPVVTPKGRGQIPTDTPAPQAPAATPAVPLSKNEELKARARVQSKAALEKYGVTAQQTNLPATSQVARVTPASYIPDTMTPKVTTAFRPSDTVVNAVDNLPETKNVPAIVKAILAVESGGKADAKGAAVRNAKGEVVAGGISGLAQMESATANSLFENFDRRNVGHNVLAATTMMQVALANPTLKANPLLAVAAYNGGEPVVAQAVRLAGTTDWNVVKDYIPQAVRANPKLSKNPGKASEIIQYVDKVVSYFPAFARTSDDYNTALTLKEAGVLDFEESDMRSPYNGVPLKGV